MAERRQDTATAMHISEKPQFHAGKWYFSRHEIERCSPSRKDGIDFEKESQLLRLYCLFIQDLGKKLKIPQVTIACALMLCHQFYMRQSHATNDWQTIATVSIFLACKIEDTPRLLRDVVVVAYEMIYKWDPSAPDRIRRTEFCDKQKELIISGETLLLTTIAFDLGIKLPYRPLFDALKKLKIFPDLAKVAWNFVNDWLSTTLCLQYKPHYIAAGSLFLAAKLQKLKLPTNKGKVWWMEFDISPKQLEEVIQEMVRLLEQDRKKALPPTDGRIAQSRASVGRMMTSSSQSTITSASIAGSHSNDGTVVESEVLGAINLKEVLPCQTSGSIVSSVINNDDGESQPGTGKFDLSSSCKIVSVRGFYSKIDANRIRETLKRRRLEGTAKKMSIETINADTDGEAWIEEELENGVELESASSKKNKQRKNVGFMGAEKQ
ncbi:cyclin-T1-3 isoform X1 [Ricinus communis]|uniref:cyclin-T1-3 isoform X1 n=2 Tax=Ricinus communis TaxID=3988 RepID=UPI00077270A4|nr:cyclin-T1-3 isoform X1 [Ricinus communis]|eukprot:XP_015577219.1 cyclin-T1-3 isoform X2 [Ricinus communis]